MVLLLEVKLIIRTCIFCPVVVIDYLTLPRDEGVAGYHGTPEAGNSLGSGPEVVETQRVDKE